MTSIPPLSPRINREKIVKERTKKRINLKLILLYPFPLTEATNEKAKKNNPRSLKPEESTGPLLFNCRKEAYGTEIIERPVIVTIVKQPPSIKNTQTDLLAKLLSASLGCDISHFLDDIINNVKP